MWGKDTTGKKPMRVGTVIGCDTQIQGDIYFKGGLHIEGHVIGNVFAIEGEDAEVVLSEHARIEGEIRVCNATINGQVIGNIYCTEKLELAKKARISGDIHYNLLQILIGAEIKGSFYPNFSKQSSLALEHDDNTNTNTNTNTVLESRRAKDSSSFADKGVDTNQDLA